MTFFPSGNRSKPGERHSYIPQARDKGKERAESREHNKKIFPRAAIFFFIIRTRLPKQIKLLYPEQQLKEKRPVYSSTPEKELSPEVTELSSLSMAAASSSSNVSRISKH